MRARVSTRWKPIVLMTVSAGGLVVTLWTMCSPLSAADPPAEESAAFLKAQQVQKLVPEWIAAGGNSDEVVPLLKKVAFSIFNSSVPPNYANNPAAKTAHHIHVINIDGTGLTRLTKPGPISIIPNWHDDLIAYVEVSERDGYSGASIVSASGRDQTPKRIRAGVNSPRWISPLR